MVSLNINSVTINPVCYILPACAVWCAGKENDPIIDRELCVTNKEQSLPGGVTRDQGPGGLLTADGTTCNDRDSHIMYTHPHTCIHVGIDVDKAFHEH